MSHPEIPSVKTFYARAGKRLFDLTLTLGGLLVIWPVLLLCAMLIKLTSRGPALFLQERLGRGGSTFSVYKFRTMTDKHREPDTIAYSGDPNEVTAIGRVLRRTRLDELPQIFNVLRGEMSIVGPRPQLPKQRTEFNADAELRLLVRPGLTGLAQINGNTSLSWPQRWHYDATYVRNLSLWLDCRIIAMTLPALIRHDDSAPQVQQSAEPRS